MWTLYQRKLPSGARVWCASHPPTDDSPRVRKTLGIPVRGRAEKAEATKLVAALNTASGGSREVMFGWALDQYLQQQTSRVYRHRIDKFRDVFGAVTVKEAATKIEEIKAASIAAGHQPGYTNMQLTMLAMVFGYFTKRGWCPPVQILRVRPGKLVTKAMSRQDEQKLLAAAVGDEAYPIILFMLKTGVRSYEAASLTWEQVDLDRGFALLTKTKNGGSRRVPLNEAVVNALRPLQKPSGKVFTANGEPYPDMHQHVYTVLRSCMTRLCKKAGIPYYNPHTTRHTFATRLVEKGVNLRVIQEIGGWKDINMLSRYAAADQDTLHRAVAQI